MKAPSFHKIAEQKITQRLDTLADQHQRDCINYLEWFAGSYELERLLTELKDARNLSEMKGESHE